jgi:hypothetical protein
MIMVGSLACRCATYIHGQIRDGFAARLAIAFRCPAGRFLEFYVIGGLPVALQSPTYLVTKNQGFAMISMAIDSPEDQLLSDR